jgi:riboflavin kinase/FMN adenylyltransferase
VLTIGTFDGVHRGHVELVRRTVNEARKRRLPSALITFDPHPAQVVRAGDHPAQLTTLTRRAELVGQLGIDVFCVIPFTRELAKQSAEEFVHELLVSRLHAAKVLVGENFTFGHRATGNIDMLVELGKRFGFEAESVRLFAEHDVTVSSTYIRSVVAAGDVAAAAEALGRPHRVEGVVVHGDGRGRELGFPTANVAPPMYAAIPADGVYAAWFSILSPARPSAPRAKQNPPSLGRVSAAVSVGTNPTFSGRERTVEAYVLDKNIDLYGQYVAVDFVRRLRDMWAFKSREELVEAIAKDVENTRKALQ